MAEKEISERHIRLAFQHESAINTLLAKRGIDTDLATEVKEKFNDSLNEKNLRTLKGSRTIMKRYTYP